MIDLASSLSATTQPNRSDPMDADAERRWAAWKARGIARERRMRERLVTMAYVAAALGVGALGVYTALFS